MTNYRNHLSRTRSAIRRRTQRTGPSRLTVCIILCACALMCKFCWPQGIPAVRDLLTGSEGGRFQRGVSAACAALGDREPLEDVVEAFWHGLQSDAQPT